MMVRGSKLHSVPRIAAWIGALCSIACSSATGTMVIDLRTDLQREVEVDRVETSLYPLGAPELALVVDTVDVGGRAELDLLEGIRLAEVGGLALGDWTVIVRALRRADGDFFEVLQRRLHVSLRGSAQAVTVLMTRDCRDVDCSGGVDGDPEALACLGGRCVDAFCSPETPELCPEAACQLDAECSAPTGAPECARPVCLQGVCAGVLDDTRCGEESSCLPDGCSEPPLGGPPEDILQLEAGSSHLCVLRRDGQVECMGRNDDGELGDGTMEARSGFALVEGISDGVALASHATSTCVLHAAGSVSCWGANDSGQLGDGTMEQRLRPTPVSGLTGASGLARGTNARHACAIVAGGSVMCWGGNDAGQLGDGTMVNRSSPVPVQGLPADEAVQQVELGGSHTCVILETGRVFCWGNNDRGQIGIGGFTNQSTAREVTLPEPAVALTGAAQTTCVALQSGAAMCWGRNINGILGNDADSRLLLETRPVPVVGLDTERVVEVHGGASHMCARAESGRAYCWGRGDDGQRGDGSGAITRTTASQVADIENFAAISAGAWGTTGLTAAGEVMRWGALPPLSGLPRRPDGVAR